MTTDDLQKGLPAAPRARLRGVTRTLFCTTALCLASLSAQAQVAPASTDTAPSSEHGAPAAAIAATSDVVAIGTSPATAPVAVANPKSSVSHAVRDRAAEAAAATLTALLPRLAASDTLPLLDRSATLAGAFTTYGPGRMMLTGTKGWVDVHPRFHRAVSVTIWREKTPEKVIAAMVARLEADPQAERDRRRGWKQNTEARAEAQRRRRARKKAEQRQADE